MWNGTLQSFVPDDIFPDQKFKIEISPEWEGLVTVYIPEGVVKDKAGNVNKSSSLTLSYGSYAVPALNVWGMAVFLVVIQISYLYFQIRKKGNVI